MPEQVAPKNTVLKIIVAVLGILILASMAAIVIGLVSGAGRSSPKTPEPVIGTERADGTLSIPVPEGARVKSLDIDRSRVLVVIESPADSRILILDRLTGDPVRTLILSPEE